MRVDLTIMGLEGSAYFDSGALTSVASQRLHQRLKADGIPSQNKWMRVKLADGHPKDLQLETYELPVQLAGRTQLTEFVVLPGSSDNETLLGVDFMEDLGVVTNAPQRAWFFNDKPDVVHLFEAPPVQLPFEGTTQALTRDDSLAMSDTVDCDKDTLSAMFDQAFATADQLISEHRGGATQVTDIGSVDVTLRPDEATMLDANQRAKLNELLVEFKDLFELRGQPTTMAEHRIDTW